MLQPVRYSRSQLPASKARRTQGSAAISTRKLAGTGRHLTPTELAAWTAFLDSSRMVEEQASAQLRADHSLSHREYEVLVRLDGFGGELRMSELAAQMVASPPLISQTVSRLEARGWVTRASSLTDGRGVTAGLTDDGYQALLQLSESHAKLIKNVLLDVIGPDDLEDYASSMKIVADHLRAHRRGENCTNEVCPLNQEEG
jgi:DNA-binding MarR family transcriptional regulator